MNESLLMRLCRRACFDAAQWRLGHKHPTQRHCEIWAGLIRYGSENAEFGPPKAGENRVVFLGDQVTELGAKSGQFFPGKPFLNRGIAGQTTAQMLVRFHQDVVALKPKVVVIQAGMNDLLGRRRKA